MDELLHERLNQNLHTEEFKVRLRPGDAERLLALARQRDVAPAVLLRSLVVGALADLHRSLPLAGDDGRPAEGLAE